MSVDPPTHPGMSRRPYPPPSPARRQTDRYSAIGFLALSLSTTVLAVVLVVVPEPHHWWHLVIAGVLVVPAGLAMYAAIGIWRLITAARVWRRSDRKDRRDR